LVVVDSTVREDGSLALPHARQGEAPALYATMEALRDWRFRPAQRAGTPVEGFYTLATNFECRR
jgi:hypothetical protein